MSNLVNHARRELELVGEEPEVIEWFVSVVEAFAKFGHSGTSAEHFIDILNRLLQFQNLKPLTNDPSEWEKHEEKFWQNYRNSAAFSKDQGETYFLVYENRTGQVTKYHDTEKVTNA